MAGLGLGQTGATGVLLKAVATERSVTAMVLWSQLEIVGYLARPAGRSITQAFRFAVGVVPLPAAVGLLGHLPRSGPDPASLTRPVRR